MLFTSDKKIIENPLHSSYKEKTFELPIGLWKKNYAKTFNVLKTWDLRRNFENTSCRYKLKFDYIHLLEKDQFDEN